MTVVTTSPQFHDRQSTSAVMWTVALALLPAAGWGVCVFGAPALTILAVSVVSAMGFEFAANLAVRRRTLRDGSAALTGLLIGMSMPPGVPLYVPAAACAFALLVVKWTFGGLGSNWMNPALAGRVFATFSWPAAMRTWAWPRTLGAVDGLAAATPLETVRQGLRSATGATGGPQALLERAGLPVSAADGTVTRWLNVHLLGPLGVDLPGGYVDLFLGNLAGSIGEVSALALLAGSIVLFGRRILRAHVPASMFLTFAAATWVFGGFPHGGGPFTGDVLFHVFSGGFLLVLLYMATDVVTSPMTRTGMLMFGVGAGLITFVLRAWGSHPEGAALAVLLMNVAVPTIDRAIRPRRFGARAGVTR